MPNFNYHSRLFANTLGPAFQGTNNLNVYWAEILYAAFTVGRPSHAHVVMHGVHSWFEMIYRGAIIFANLKENSRGLILKSDAYKSLDPSEKSAISYFLGLTFSKLLANRLLSIPWLMHLQVYRHILHVSFLNGRSQPDLVGQDSSGNWFVIEAKGRTSKIDSNLMIKAKAQTQRVGSISGNSNITRIALVVYFDKNILNVHWEDPDELRRGIDIPINNIELIIDYYEPFRQLFTVNEFNEGTVSHSGNEFRLIKLPASDTSIGINVEISTMLMKKNYEGIYEYLKEKPDIQIKDRPGNIFIGKDGIMVVTGKSWETAEMKKEPIARTNNV